MQDRAQAQRDAFEDLRQGIGDGGDLGGFGIDVEGDADDDVAEVIGTGDRRGDHGEAQRGALVGAGEVDLAGEVDGVGAGAGAGLSGADLAGRRAARVGLLCEAGVAGVGRGGERCVGAVGDALQGRREARRGRDGQGG